jgi:P-type Cu+ transporter
MSTATHGSAPAGAGTGAAAAPGETRYSFAVGGMTCSACAARIEKALRRVPGVVEANVNLALERADVRAVRGEVDERRLAEAVTKAGYTATFAAAAPGDAGDQADAEARADEQLASQRAGEQRALDREYRRLLFAVVLTTPLVVQMVLMWLGVPFHLSPWVELALATPVQFVVGARFYVAAWKAVRAGSGNMDVLVSMGTSAAYFYSVYLMWALGHHARGQLYFEAAAVIITLVLLGKYFEARAKRSTTAAIRQLMDLRPKTARVLREAREVEVPVAQLRRGDVVVVRPGERIPVDGTVSDGSSEVDEALITGESIPVGKHPGDAVTGGAINGTGLLRITTTAVGEDSTLAKIIRLVENAQAGKAPIQRLVDRVSAIFVPVVILIAVLTFVAWYVFGGELEPALIAAVSVLVIGCPCALGLATPTAIMTGTGAAARAGILIKNVEALERAHAVDTVIFDKTGTLTTGHPAVVAVHAVDGDERQLLHTLASLQQGSEHPLAKAVLARAAELGLAPHPVSDFRSHTGLGVAGTVDGARVIAGNAQFMQDHGIAVDAGPSSAEATRAAQWESAGSTVIWVAREQALLGTMAIADPLRPESRAAVARLRALGVRTLLLSGDAARTAEEIGRQVGVDSARGGVRPEDKSAAVQALRAQGRVVAMVGDGINDAPALAAADLGIAMGSGTDVAMETAGVTLMRATPVLVPDAIAVSRATWRKIRQNLFWAFIYNVVAIPVAALGLLSPAVAGAAMAFSSVSVVTNSLWLRRWQPARNEGSK